MRQLDLQSLLAAVDVPVDWVGIREVTETHSCLLYTSPSPRDKRQYRMPWSG